MARRRRRPPLPRSIRIRPRRGVKAGGVFVVVLLAALAVYDRRASNVRSGNDWARYHNRRFRVIHVVDGDTFDLDVPDTNGQLTRVRLWGVDTPELGHGKGPDMYFSREALKFAQDRLQGREVLVMLSPRRTRDKYGRLLVYARTGQNDPTINELLLDAGLAYADSRFDHDLEARFKAGESRARGAGIGLWSGVSPADMPEWRQRIESAAKRRRGG